MKFLTSEDNDLIKLISKLHKSAQFRKKTGPRMLVFPKLAQECLYYLNWLRNAGIV